MSDLVAGTLSSAGWTTWASTLDLLGADSCLWTDLRGAHHGPAPAERPIGTHLWAWRPGRWVRVRIDGDRVLSTVLTEGLAEAGEPVTGEIADGVPWGADERAAAWHLPVVLLVTEGQAPLTFARVSTTTQE
ncbi:hypothetical protein [Pseudonocardia oroxyli]|uniref:Uncharacterized protein n=1 Tax=Pseudonocardia oroxyli TaxID=366584 RepID=A0A1G8CQR2_PSEOR|nr:hypothetical protein [Pseudonocardia oroxyli]SDH47825.1 hypothetical protein SAMN05216377_12332 [Pseudonocardia oroxyli]